MTETFVNIVLEDIPATADLGGRKYYGTLPAGYLWELQESYLYLDTDKAASAAACLLWGLYDASGNRMAVASGAGALTQANVMTKSAVYTTVDASAAAAQVYATYETSGAGENVGEGVRICARFKAIRPGVAA